MLGRGNRSSGCSKPTTINSSIFTTVNRRPEIRHSREYFGGERLHFELAHHHTEAESHWRDPGNTEKNPQFADIPVQFIQPGAGEDRGRVKESWNRNVANITAIMFSKLALVVPGYKSSQCAAVSSKVIRIISKLILGNQLALDADSGKISTAIY